ncbi:RagB/SusD family nutrient uptake outer membrane protein [Flavobacterium sp. NRK1]|uniref:RagB/SusD family nutrient uptake outer membrane protein n=1 Tax=Flavobacterium sp. NRK1 TaxID=2954929 RepID=UPI0020936A6F|nr:RagB/SusD family nutrient uptake outer membrane protein [Flavobacterium sp. NRK1]MCO6148316.1 RagB/SusD family nutrient uptake outer membrane protein [Flavobacterium sp. NRK1]
MKNLKILLFVVVASLFAACDDAIDIIQPSELLPQDTFETVGDLSLGLNGVYGLIPGEDHIIFTSIFTDEVKIGYANGGQGKDGGLAFLLNANSGDADAIWASNYRLINAATRLIEGAKNVNPVDEENGIDQSEEYSNIIAQARALRAYGHFQLLTFFSENLKDDNALGVIALDFVPTIQQQLPRNTNGEVFALIDSDLAFAQENLQLTTSGNKSSLRDYVSTDFVKALKARMAAYRGQYNVAEQLADELIVSYGLTGKYAQGQSHNLDLSNRDQLLVRSNYYKLFRDGAFTPGNTNEVIFKAGRAATPNDATGNFYQAWSSVNTSITGSPFFEVSAALYNQLLPDDIRRTVIIDPTAYPSFSIRPVGKYSESETVFFLADLKIFRSSEMVLIKAEARANANDFAGVAEQINIIRDARFGNEAGQTNGHIAVPGSAQEAWAAILDERRIELAFEGFRYIDIKRLGTLAGKGIDRAPSDCAFNGACNLELNDHRWTLPIPRRELSGNANIQQNSGY